MSALDWVSGLEDSIDRLEAENAALRTRAEAAEAEAAALKKLEAAHRGEEARRAADLHQQLAEAKTLVPEAGLLRFLADQVEHEVRIWPRTDRRAQALEQVNRTRELADRIEKAADAAH